MELALDQFARPWDARYVTAFEIVAGENEVEQIHYCSDCLERAQAKLLLNELLRPCDSCLDMRNTYVQDVFKAQGNFHEAWQQWNPCPTKAEIKTTDGHRDLGYDELIRMNIIFKEDKRFGGLEVDPFQSAGVIATVILGGGVTTYFQYKTKRHNDRKYEQDIEHNAATVRHYARMEQIAQDQLAATTTHNDRTFTETPDQDSATTRKNDRTDQSPVRQQSLQATDSHDSMEQRMISHDDRMPQGIEEASAEAQQDEYSQMSQAFANEERNNQIKLHTIIEQFEEVLNEMRDLMDSEQFMDSEQSEELLKGFRESFKEVFQAVSKDSDQFWHLMLLCAKDPELAQRALMRFKGEYQSFSEPRDATQETLQELNSWASRDSIPTTNEYPMGELGNNRLLSLTALECEKRSKEYDETRSNNANERELEARSSAVVTAQERGKNFRNWDTDIEELGKQAEVFELREYKRLEWQGTSDASEATLEEGAPEEAAPEEAAQ